MARTRPATEHPTSQNSPPAAESKVPTSALPVISQWLHGSLAVVQQTSDWLMQLQHTYIDDTLSWSETLASEWKGIQAAKDPLQFVTTQSEAADEQLDLYAKHMTAAMQELYDSQLLWLGQWDKTVEAAEAVKTSEAPDISALVAWGKVQDEWLQVSRSWIDSMKSLDATK